MTDYYRPRRSMLYVPGCNPHYLEKARSLQVDSIILDLGAPILLSAKEESRANVVKELKKGGYGNREVVVRVNDLDSEWGYDDVNAVANLGADAILFSSIENQDDVMAAINAMEEAGNTETPIMVMIESPLAVLHAEEIARASDRIACMVLATSDLISDLHARPTLERTAIRTSLSWVVLAARAYGRAVIDGIHSDLKDMQAFEYACRIGRDMGFDGKSLVHPFQLPYANDAYTPKPAEVEMAKEIIEALSEANKAGRGTVLVNGKLVEHHHVTAAKRFLLLSDMIKELELDND
ncbi:HpcH/HpaI aldolase/citrate lyase family protein [Methylophaga sp. OBS1]|uniref:HpcH/HpaI aldolase/citrate lyase family protein n=1 Tax=Methylophaga sp. OBS1 TaxID=2991933 RepID=UPI002251F353|nr:CoA ester lyase [Methylophaga sp. OBS1]MCX4194016.1 CoA ester lyase [Methylophaga sp. OBS1]